jgi:hypothetical protein
MSQAITTIHNRRLTRRRVPKGGTRVVCRKGTFGLGADLAFSVLDISESGIRLLVRQSLAEGQEIELGLTGPGQGRTQRLLATVVWCVPAADGRCCIGARFERTLPYKDLQLFATLGAGSTAGWSR